MTILSSNGLARSCFVSAFSGLLALVAVANTNGQTVPSQNCPTSPSGCPCIPSNQCLTRPNQGTACSSSNVGIVEAWAANAKVMVYIDASAFTATQIQNIQTVFTNWESSGSNVTFTFTVTLSIPTVFSQTSYVSAAATASGLIASGKQVQRGPRPIRTEL